MEPNETIAELAQRYQLEDEAEAYAVARAHKLDGMRRAGIRFDPALAFFGQFAPRAAQRERRSRCTRSASAAGFSPRRAAAPLS